MKNMFGWKILAMRLRHPVSYENVLIKVAGRSTHAGKENLGSPSLVAAASREIKTAHSIQTEIKGEANFQPPERLSAARFFPNFQILNHNIHVEPQIPSVALSL